MTDWREDTFAPAATKLWLARTMLDRVICYRMAHNADPEALPVTVAEETDLKCTAERLDYVVVDEDGLVLVDGVPVISID